MFPRLDKHCPFKAQLAEAMDGDLCSICNHVVHDLDAMTPEARRDFMHGSGTVCVRYKLPAALAAAALAASVAALPAAAQEAPAPPQEAEDDGAIVGVMSRVPLPDPCRVVLTVRGRQTADDKACRRERAIEKWPERFPGEY